MRRTGTRGGWVSVLTLVVAAACTTALPTPTESTAPPGVSGGSPEAPAEIDPDGQLVTNIFFEPRTIDPHRADLVPEVGVVTNVFENLMVLDPVTQLPVPGAAAAPPEVLDGGRRFVFTLRDGLTYSDGAPLTAADFVYGYTRTCDPRTASPHALTLDIIVGCADWSRMDPTRATEAELAEAAARLGVRALDDSRIEFTTIQPAPYFPFLTTTLAGLPVRAAILEEHGEDWTEPPAYIGNGPFRLVEWRHNEYMVFERNENYRLPVALASWRMVMVSDSAVEFAAYRNGEIDVIRLRGEHVRAVEQDPELLSHQIDVPLGGTSLVAFNVTKPPFDDPRVRLAFARALDRRAYVDTVLSGVGRPATGFIAFGQPGHDPEDDGQSFDPAEARELLDGSTYGGAAGLPVIRLSHIATTGFAQNAEWVAREWTEHLGAEVALDPIDNPTFQQIILDPTTAPPAFTTALGSSLHPRNWLTLPWSTGGTLAYRAGYSSPEFDRTVAAADTTLDQDRAIELYREAGRTLSREAPGAWLSYTTSLLLVKPWVAGYHVTGRGFGDLNKHEIYLIRR